MQILPVDSIKHMYYQVIFSVSLCTNRPGLHTLKLEKPLVSSCVILDFSSGYSKIADIQASFGTKYFQMRGRLCGQMHMGVLGTKAFDKH